MKYIKLRIAALTVASSFIMSISGCSKEADSASRKFELNQVTNYFSDETELLSIYDKLKYVEVYLTDDEEIVLLTKLGVCKEKNSQYEDFNHVHYKNVVTNEIFIGHTHHNVSDGSIPKECLKNTMINDQDLLFRKSYCKGNVEQYLNYTEMDKIINNEFTHEDLTVVTSRLQEQYDKQKKLVKR